MIFQTEFRLIFRRKKLKVDNSLTESLHYLSRPWVHRFVIILTPEFSRPGLMRLEQSGKTLHCSIAEKVFVGKKCQDGLE